jgi:hypothetical protein
VNGARACRRCGTQLAQQQEYCLECGARQGVVPRRPVHWLWPAGAAAFVAAAAAAAAIAAGADEGKDSTIVALGRLQPVAAARPEHSGRTARLRQWPHRDGYTIVLAALPFTARPAAARARAKQAAKAGLPDVGVLESRRFASLHPGYLMVFSGVYRSLDEALAALPRAAHAVPHAYVQEINR